MAMTEATPCRAEVLICAPPAVVWHVLIDLAGYESWRCPFTERMEVAASPPGLPLAVGDAIIETVRMAPGDRAVRLQEVRVTELQPGVRLCWEGVMGAQFLLHARRSQTLTAVAGGAQTLYRTADVMTGLLAPLVLSLYGASVRRGFESIAAALKARAEALAHAAVVVAPVGSSASSPC